MPKTPRKKTKKTNLIGFRATEETKELEQRINDLVTAYAGRRPKINRSDVLRAATEMLLERHERGEDVGFGAAPAPARSRKGRHARPVDLSRQVAPHDQESAGNSGAGC